MKLRVPLLAGLLAMTPHLALAQNSLIDRLEQAQKSIVTVTTELTRTLPTNPPRMVTYYRVGAGIILDASGIIVTNTHTIINAPYIYIVLRDGTKLPAKVVFSSDEFDFSFLRIDPAHPLDPIRWANSSLAGLGQDIIAIGNSNYDNQSLMAGHIEGIYQSHSTSSNDFFELDLSLHHGDSGGPVLDENGRLLGIIMAKRASAPNSSIAIASNKIRLQYLQYRKNMP